MGVSPVRQSSSASPFPPSLQFGQKSRKNSCELLVGHPVTMLLILFAQTDPGHPTFSTDDLFGFYFSQLCNYIPYAWTRLLPRSFHRGTL